MKFETTRLEGKRSEATQRSYDQKFTDYSQWCFINNIKPLPADPDKVAEYLRLKQREGLKKPTLMAYYSAINYHHRSFGHLNLSNYSSTAAVIDEIKNMNHQKIRKVAATMDLIVAMIASCPNTLRGTRDRAILSIGFAGALRRSELANLNMEDILSCEDSLVINIPRSKTDQEGKGQTISIPGGSVLRVKEHLYKWIDQANISGGPIFRRVLKSGIVGDRAINGKSIAGIVKIYASRVGLNVSDFSGGSLRAGFITTSANHRESLFEIVKVSRHKTFESLKDYIRSDQLLPTDPAGSFI